MSNRRPPRKDDCQFSSIKNIENLQRFIPSIKFSAVKVINERSETEEIFKKVASGTYTEVSALWSQVLRENILVDCEYECIGPPLRKVFSLVNLIQCLPKRPQSNFPYQLDRNGAGKTFLYELINLITVTYKMKFLLPMISTTKDGRYDWCGYDYVTDKTIIHKLHGVVDFQVAKNNKVILIGECKHGSSDGLYQLVASLCRCSQDQGDIPLGLYFFDKCIVHLVKFVSQDYVLQWKYDLHNFNILLYLIEDIYTVLEKSCHPVQISDSHPDQLLTLPSQSLRIGTMEGKLEAMEGKLVAVERKLEAKLNTLEGKLENITDLLRTTAIKKEPIVHGIV